MLPVPTGIIVLAGATLSALFLYGLYLEHAISYAVEHEDLLSQAQTIKAETADLDSAYVALQDTITLEHAKALGFHEVTDPLYVSLSKKSTALGIRLP